jgi:hypothetical protein
MDQLYSSLNNGQFVGLSVFGCCLVVVLVAVVGGWTEIRKAELAAALKHDMLDRGLSAEEIRMVLDAGTKHSRRAAAESHAAYCG